MQNERTNKRNNAGLPAVLDEAATETFSTPARSTVAPKARFADNRRIRRFWLPGDPAKA
jgi:hypothetical protein